MLNWVFHWIADKPRVLKDIIRILQPGGKVGFTIPSQELRELVGLSRIVDGVLGRSPYKAVVKAEKSTQKQYNLAATELIELLSGLGLKIEDVHLQVKSRTFTCAQDVTKFLEASFFGNYLNHVPDNMREQAKAEIEQEFEAQRIAAGLQFDYYPLFAVAQKPE